MIHRQLAEQPLAPVHGARSVQKRVLVAAGEVGDAMTQLSQAYFPPGEGVEAHAHADMAEVFLVERGRGSIEIDGVAHALAPGACFVVEAGERHALRNTGDAELVVTYLGLLTGRSGA